jgi:hypothetical protein
MQLMRIDMLILVRAGSARVLCSITCRRYALSIYQFAY